MYKKNHIIIFLTIVCFMFGCSTQENKEQDLTTNAIEEQITYPIVYDEKEKNDWIERYTGKYGVGDNSDFFSSDFDAIEIDIVQLSTDIKYNIFQRTCCLNDGIVYTIEEISKLDEFTYQLKLTRGSIDGSTNYQDFTMFPTDTYLIRDIDSSDDFIELQFIGVNNTTLDAFNGEYENGEYFKQYPSLYKNPDEWYVFHHKNKVVNQNSINEDLTDLINTPYKAKSTDAIKVRIKPSVDAAIRGYVRPDDCFEVFETIKDDEYIWCRIGTNAWVANDGTWIERIPYESTIIVDYPNLIKPKTYPKRIENSYVSGQVMGPDGPYKGKTVTTYLFNDANEFIGYVSESEGNKIEIDYMMDCVPGFYVGSTVENKEENGKVVSQIINGHPENEIEYDAAGRMIKSFSLYNLTDQCISYRYENGKLSE